jgi:hypothetical protein
MFFPWVGFFEQVRLADIFVHYDDVQLPQGRSFIRRVQIKTPNGSSWLSAPICKGANLISEAKLDDSQHWRETHRKKLRHNYTKAPFAPEMLALAEDAYAQKTDNLCEFNIYSIEKIAAYFGLTPCFLRSSQLGVGGAKSERLLQIVQKVGGTTYITGHGARNYLDHLLFEAAGIRVEYMHYQCLPYPQLYGAFTPFVSILDLIANMGREGRRYILSHSVYWKEFLQ